MLSHGSSSVRKFSEQSVETKMQYYLLEVQVLHRLLLEVGQYIVLLDLAEISDGD